MNNTKIDIVIVGAGLTGLTIAFYVSKAGFKVKVLEKESRCGGVMQTHVEEGFTYESGPNTGVVSSTELVELFDDLGLEFEYPQPEAQARWIWKKGKWHALPSGLISAIATPLFSFKDKIRILGEPFRRKTDNKNETLAHLVKRRMGKSFLTYAVDPFISGIYAGDPAKLITRFAMPKLYALEQNYGSFIKGTIKKQQEAKTELEKRVNKNVFSVKGGLGKLIEVLAEKIGNENILTNVEQLKVMPIDGGFTSSYSIGDEIFKLESAKVITTTDAFSFSELCPFLPGHLVNSLSNISYAKVLQVAVGYRNWQGIPLPAFGGLVPSIEKKDILGILFPSSLFTNRAPEGGALLSVFMGGVKRPDLFEKSDEEIFKLTRDSLIEMLKTPNEPDFIRVFRYRRAIPQYDITTEARLEAIDNIHNMYPGFVIAGNLHNGIGMSDRVKQARQTAYRISFQS